ncbi:MAG: alpha-E domain-containing protein [Actinobacteria bacterium]|nr:alpha-E domain-containing protein [Actinomycetota bacterium]
MLARTAEYLFWTGRYLERAEDTARLLDVTYHRLLEATPGHEEVEAWLDVLRAVGLADEFEVSGRTLDGWSVSEYLVLDPANRGSIRQCVTQARSNARGVRELLAVELWEALNSLHLDLQSRDLALDVQLQPHELYGLIRQGVQSVIGVVDGTWVRDDAWRFFMLGLLLERAEMGVRSLRIRQSRHDEDVHEWFATLRAASALGAYRRRYATFEPEALIELLLLSSTLPRSVLFSLRGAETILTDLVADERSLSLRLLGRLRAELEFADPIELVGPGLESTLEVVEARIREVAAAVAAESFLYRVDLGLHSLHLVPGGDPR